MNSDTRKIIKIVPTSNNDYFNITWEMGNRCNNECCYCHPGYHSFDGKIFPLEELQKKWMSIFEKTHTLGKKYRIAFTGGEVTVQKNFIGFLKWIRSEYNEYLGPLVVTSNGSASAQYYINLAELVDHITISIHSESINEIDFFTKLIKLKKSLPKRIIFFVHVMDEPWNRDRIPYYEYILKTNGIGYVINKLMMHEENDPLTPKIVGDLNFDLSKSYKLQLRNNP